MRKSNTPLKPRGWETTIAMKWAHDKATPFIKPKYSGPAIPAFSSLNRKNTKKRPITLAKGAADGD